MRKPLFAMVAGVVLVGCSQKSQEAQNAANALKVVAGAATTMEENQSEAEKFYKERKEKGDTLAMPYADLQNFLPSPSAGYAAAGEPGGSSQNMAGFSMSQVEQTYNQPAGADGNSPSLHVTIVDLGGTQAAYGMMAVPMMMNLSQEDAHHRMATMKMSVPFTWASEEYDKDNKVSKVSAITRYRYMITVEARNQTSDQTAMVKDVVEGIVKTLEGK